MSHENITEKTTGPGTAKCECGWESETLVSGAARKKAHAEHAFFGDAVVEEDLIGGNEDLIGEDLIGDVVADTPKEEEVTAPKKAPAKKAAAKKAAPALVEETPAPKAAAKKAAPAPAPKAPPKEGTYLDVEFSGAPKNFFQFLARKGAVDFVARQETSVTAETNGLTVRLVGGTVKERKALASQLPSMWTGAMVALRASDKANAAQLKKLKLTAEGRKKRFTNEGDFLVEFCANYEGSDLL